MGKSSRHIKQILELAKLSPSSHNTQPWQVNSRPDGIVVGYAQDRQLMIGDPSKRELFISLGCFIETAIWAARGMGYEASYKYLGTDQNKVAELNFKKTGKTDTEIPDIIAARRSDRRRYESKKIPVPQLGQLKSLRVGRAKPVVFERDDDIEFLSRMTYEATLSGMKRNEFRRELASWVRNNWTKKSDGMPAYTQGIPGPVSLIAKQVIAKNPKVAVSQAKKDARRVLESSAIVIITLDKEDARGWLDAGRLFQQLSLTGLTFDLKSAAVSAAVIEQVTSNEIKRRLELSGVPVALIRLGYAKGLAKPTPRRKVEDFLD